MAEKTKPDLMRSNHCMGTLITITENNSIMEGKKIIMASVICEVKKKQNKKYHFIQGTLSNLPHMMMNQMSAIRTSSDGSRDISGAPGTTH